MKYEYLRGSEKDFEGAPEWATVLTKNNEGCLAWDEGRTNAAGLRYLWIDDQDNSCVMKYDEDHDETELNGIIAERRQITEPVVNQQLTTGWDGEGLPPVGALCRYRAFSDTPWVECEVLGWHDDEVWLKPISDGVTFIMGNPELFPIRSPEDVARDEAVKEIRDKLTLRKEVAEDFYEFIAAGKIPGITKTPTVSELMRVTENATREDCEAIVKMLSGK